MINPQTIQASQARVLARKALLAFACPEVLKRALERPEGGEERALRVTEAELVSSAGVSPKRGEARSLILLLKREGLILQYGAVSVRRVAREVRRTVNGYETTPALVLVMSGRVVIVRGDNANDAVLRACDAANKTLKGMSK